MHGEAAGDQVGVSGSMLREGVAVARGLDQASGADQRFEALGKLLAFASAQSHLADQLLESGRAVRLPFDVVQDGLISQHVKVKSANPCVPRNLRPRVPTVASSGAPLVISP